MATNPENHQPPSSSDFDEPTLYYLSQGLRLLSNVASHVQRCSMCYAVQEESEHIEGGWSIATSNGCRRTSIVDNPLFLELTAGSSYFCLSCFQHCFGGATLIPSSPDDGLNLEDDSPAQDYQWGSASEKASRGHGSTSDFKETVHTMVRDDESGKNISTIETSRVIPYSPSTCQELQSRKFKQSSLLISVSDIYLEGLNDLNAMEDDCGDMRREKVMKMENDQCDSKSIEIRSIVYGENNITADRKGEPSPPGRNCSRINGRGWQCKKMPLPGYALCEYHLDLARTRILEKKLN